jgi:phosphotriesterase-related protein
MKINTVLGSCDPGDLGPTLVHEHLLTGMPGAYLDAADFDRKREFATVSGAVEKVKQHGIATLIDPCPMELGRDPEFAAAISDRTGMRVIMSTGLYNDALGIPTHFRMLDSDEIAELYVREITEGIGSTGIKAGLIKSANSGMPNHPGEKGITRVEEKVFRAAARAQKATGVPILVHNSETAPFGREVLDIFQSEGVEPKRVMIGHSCGVGDMRYYFDILERGAWLGFDRFGIEAVVPDRMRLASLIGLLGVGQDRIMLAHDTVACWLGRLGKNMRNFLKGAPKWKLTHISEDILPALRKAGVSEDAIDTLMVKNPRDYFAA